MREEKYLPNTRKILSTSTTDKHHRVLLQIVALAGNIAKNALSRRQLDARNLSLGRVRFLGLHRLDFDAYTLALVAAFEVGRL